MKNVFDASDYKYQLRKNPIKIWSLFSKDIKCCIQRITRGYCDKDIWNVNDWFLSVAPDMLQQLKDTRHGSPNKLGEEYVNEDGWFCNDKCHEEWDRILQEMIFLFREADEKTCQRKNPYDEDHSQVSKEFEDKYGLFGERLLTDEEINTESNTIHFPCELPEYNEIEQKYFNEECAIEKYRDECKNKAFHLFSKWFWDLWD